MGAGVNTAQEDGLTGSAIHYNKSDGRGYQRTLPEAPATHTEFMDGGSGAYTVAIPAVSAAFALPFPGDEYILIANGGTAYCMCGGAGVAATTAAGGFDFVVADGIHFRCRPPFTHVAVIGTAAAGTLSFVRIRKV